MICLGCHCSQAQSISLQDRLYYTCKVWGFVKYYHSEVSVCNVNWDSVLLAKLPGVRNAGTIDSFNDVLDSMIAAAGPMALSTSYFPDTLPAELKRNRDFSWMGAPSLRNDVRIQLDTIKNNFRPHDECWVQNNTYTTPYGGWLVFPYDSIELNVNTHVSYPNADSRMLVLFKYWNLVRYFYPYNYVLDVPWDTTLYSSLPKMDSVADPTSLFYLCLKINTGLNDVHVYGLTQSSYDFTPPGYYQPNIRLNYIEGRYVVVKSLVAGIYPGDAIVSVDGFTPTQMEDSLRPYYSSGNISVFRRSMCQNLLSRNNYNTAIATVVEDSTGTTHSFNLHCTVSPYTNYHGFYYPNDSLNNISWTTMNCDIGYVNMGNLRSTGVDSMYYDLWHKNAIIFDIRNYPQGTAWPIANLMYANQTEFTKLTTPDVTYPGTYYWYHDYLGYNGNATPYTGKVIILMNQETQSQAEFSCMILEAMPDVVKIGSQTAGADGNVSYWQLTDDIYTGFTTLGVFYPNGDSTQRIGIVPDSIVYPTRAGIRHKDDEMLNKALQLACTEHVPLTRPAVVKVKAFPNPANDMVNISVEGVGTQNATIQVSDIMGRVLATQNTRNNGTATFDIKGFPTGIYIVTVHTEAGSYVTRFVKE